MPAVIVDSAVHVECFVQKPCWAGWKGMCVSILGSRSFSSVLAARSSSCAPIPPLLLFLMCSYSSCANIPPCSYFSCAHIPNMLIFLLCSYSYCANIHPVLLFLPCYADKWLEDPFLKPLNKVLTKKDMK